MSVLDYSAPAANGRTRRVPRAVSVIAGMCVLTVTALTLLAIVADARLWCEEVGSTCGTGRLSIQAHLLVQPLVIGFCCLITWLTNPKTKSRMLARYALFGCVSAWLTAFIWISFVR